MLFGYKGFDATGKIFDGYISADNKRDALTSLRIDKEIIALIYIKRKFDNPMLNKTRKFISKQKNDTNQKILNMQQSRKIRMFEKREQIKAGDVSPFMLSDLISSVKSKIKTPKGRKKSKKYIPSGANVYYIEKLDDYELTPDELEQKEIVKNDIPKKGRKINVEDGREIDWASLMPEEQSMEIKKNNRIRVKEKEIVLFTRQLRMMLSSGVSLMKSLRLLRDTSSKKLAGIIDSVISSIEKGSSLSLAMSKFPRQFNSIYISLVNIGETSGSLTKSLSDIIYYKEKNMKVKKKIKSASIYPAIIAFILGLLLILGSIYFIPMFEEMFTSQGIQLPWLTKMVFAVANKIPILIAVIVFLIFFISSLRKLSRVFDTLYRSIYDFLLLKLPIIKKAVNASYMYTFSSSTALMLENGIRLKDALHLTEKAMKNLYLKYDVSSTIDLMVKGFSLSESISNQKYFDDLLVSVIATGEESGRMSESLREISEYYDEELNKQITTLMEIIQPAFILMIAAIVVPVIIAVYLPIIDISSGAMLGL